MKQFRLFGSLLFAATLALSNFNLDAASSSSFGKSSSSGFSGGSSSGSFGRSSSGGSSWGSSGSKSSTGSSTVSKSSSWGKSSSDSRPAASKTDKFIADKSAVTSRDSKVAATRSSQVSDFKAKNAQRYTTTFSYEPSVRPSYIPHGVSVGNNYYPVYYYNGGYGYYDYLGHWMLYDALSAQAEVYANSQPYYADSQPAVYHHHYIRSFFESVFNIVFFLFGISVIVGVIVSISYNNRRW